MKYNKEKKNKKRWNLSKLKTEKRELAKNENGIKNNLKRKILSVYILYWFTSYYHICIYFWFLV